ncbi:acetyl-CoA hydrolase/transferase family protein [Anaerovorax odorimutans]|uniref:acetyl-CoA hydrolase/transferase family protein n=1 Tax=Anaerovorax odorimutans TaxID=109327 RepID=UPI000401CC00|nr:acetyl-CoA hydrolase/transferase family protein [Anaerovorax odorimutans]
MENGLELRLRSPKAFNLIRSAGEAAEMIKDGMVIGVSGFTPSGYPKAVPLALAERGKYGEKLKIDLYTGASVGPEIDTALTEAGMIRRRLPYHTNGTIREKINDGMIEYLDMHLSQCPQYVNYGMLKKVDVAIVEALAITEDGNLIPTTAIGNSPTFIKSADKVIVEINLKKPLAMEGMADIYMTENPPNRKPIPICNVADRIGTTYIECGFDKIAAIVITDLQDRTRPLSEEDENSKKISKNIIKFFDSEVKSGRLSKSLLPLQSGVGSVANAVLYGLCDSEYEDLTCYTEVVQDSMLDLLRAGKAKMLSTTALSPSPIALEKFLEEIDFFKEKIILRPVEISNNPEVVRRLGVISINTAIEADIYGNVNSTHIMGSKLMNGIGGSGDFSRNGSITIFSTVSTAKGGRISSIVPMVSHVDHTEHEVMVLVTEQGFADLRGLSPKERAIKIIENCAHPDYREALMDYFKRSCESAALQTPHILEEALSWHSQFMETGSMK